MNTFGVSSILFQGDSITDGNRGRNDDFFWDGIHPTPAGHALIKNRWMDFYSKRFISDSGISGGGQACE
ncbi:lysophospholipase L1-like esterase [Paenibacillus sp. V4I9]|uniref:hypothetical protein n=1 Tax=Paenibacillus sp. V4I9 TaxID=3042308 RepID=UPI0027890D5E|nr:hypothetical protein [Paenibacillus sp. V4I9]MDQ0885509.1 lysophospholipase L1-like esterase [Paenibacillus sp. V4I9]